MLQPEVTVELGVIKPSLRADLFDFQSQARFHAVT